MTPYLVTFGISSFFCGLGEYYDHRGRDIKCKFFTFLAVLSVSILAGVRDLNIGSDIWTYGEWAFNAARENSNLISFISHQADLELMYNVLVWVVARFASDSHWLYFFTGFLIYYFVMKGIRNYKNQVSITLAWIVFLLLYYGDTLNAMRQFISVAIAFWGLKFGFDRKYKKYIIVTTFAVLFHTTAILSVLIMAISIFLRKKDSVSRRILVVFVISAIAVAYSQILNIGIGIGLLSDKYLRYLSDDFALSLNPVLIRMPFLLLIGLYYNVYCHGERKYVKSWNSIGEGDVIVLLLIVDTLISAMRGTVSTLYRAAFQFGIYRTVAYSRVYSALKESINRVTIISILLICLIVIWIYQNVIMGNNEIYPYTSQILGLG